MSKPTSSCFNLKRLHYHPSVVDDHGAVLVGVFVMSPDAKALAFYSAPLAGADEMDQVVVNATLTELCRETSADVAYRSVLDTANTLRLDVASPLKADDMASASAEALRVLMDARREPAAGRAAGASA